MDNGKHFSKLSKIFIFATLSSTLAFIVSGCSSTSKDTIVLRILNVDDYIYLNNPSDGYDEPDLYDGQFREYLKENYPEFDNKKIEIIYDTTDSNETMYSKIQTGKANYDLMACSDYMVQKLMAEDRIVPIDKSLVPNYFPNGEDMTYVSPYISDVCKKINTTTYSTKENRCLFDYGVGYMWGTCGITINSEYQDFIDRGLDAIDDFCSWSAFWNPGYKNTFSVKNDMRTIYYVGQTEYFKDEFTLYKKKYEDGEITSDEYFEILNEICARNDEETAKKVFNILNPLKENSFGFEIDSGKQDIVTKKIGAQMSFSGDAGYSIYQAGDRFQVTEPFDLYYSIPSLVGCFWVDCWTMPKMDRTEEQNKLAHAFLNFLCEPVYAKKNMEYTGYTPVVGGAEVRDYVLDCYDSRTDSIYVLEEQKDKDVYYSIFYENPTSENELTEAWYNDCLYYDDQDRSFDNVPLKYYKGNYDYDYEKEYYYDTDSGEEITFESAKMIPLEEKYNQRFEILPEWDVIDLSYIFEGTIPEATEDDFIFYCDSYYVDEGKECVGGAFFAQYPEKETLIRCPIAKDYRENNKTIMKLWEEFKATYLPTWAIVMFVIEAVFALAIIGFIVYKRVVKKKIRVKRINEKES